MAAKRPAWWARRSAAALLLTPLGGLYLAIGALRALAYRCGLLQRTRLPVPVIVVGNIAAGGSGKTPVVLWLIEHLRARGWHPGVLSRGYGGSAQVPMAVDAESDPRECGDEPVLLARRAACPLWIGRSRAEAGQGLLAVHPEVDVLVTDDGLQHLALARDLEFVVLDEAILGNGLPLPAGPLREPFSRLQRADALILNGPCSPALQQRLPPGVPVARMLLEPGDAWCLHEPTLRRPLAEFVGRDVVAAAGIGHPQRFFATLAAAGLEAQETRAFADHHAFSAADLHLSPGQILMLTEKDAVKCAAFAPADTWVLPVAARLEAEAFEPLLERLHGSQTA